MASRPIEILKWCHRRLLPQDRQEGWIPYLWLAYLAFFIFYAVRLSKPGEGLISFAGLAVFLVIYFRGYQVRGRRLMVVIACVSALGLVLLPVNPTASMFQIYAAAFCGRLNSRRLFAFALACIFTPFLSVVWWLDYPLNVGIFTLFFATLVGVINMYYSEVDRKNAQLKLSQEEIKQLAALAERERIARDLHDLLGHTLSVITLKAELAARLLERSDPRAGKEIREVETISRDALRQVREAIAGFRSVGLGGELANARLAFDAMEIRFDYEPPPRELGAEQEAVLAMVVREAVTNIVRHSNADTCRIHFQREADRLQVLIQDNGHAGDLIEGSGIAGMRDRLAGVGGHLEIEQAAGVCLKIHLPPIPSIKGAQPQFAGIAERVTRLQPEQPT